MPTQHSIEASASVIEQWAAAAIRSAHLEIAANPRRAGGALITAGVAVLCATTSEGDAKGLLSQLLRRRPHEGIRGASDEGPRRGPRRS